MSLETTEASEYVASAVAETSKDIPSNLPTVGYSAIASSLEEDSVSELTDLENQAHSKKVLLSSDAMRFFIAKVALVEDRATVLDTVIEKARVTFPSEDGWVVLNLARMEGILDEVNQEQDEVVSDENIDIDFAATPAFGGSLAEAILSKNIPSAYELIALRPMLALADASTDLDALYRYRKGENTIISDMLKKESENITEAQLQNAISALTSALDGTYTDEAAAVKMAIMKAVTAVS